MATHPRAPPVWSVNAGSAGEPSHSVGPSTGGALDQVAAEERRAFEVGPAVDDPDDGSDISLDPLVDGEVGNGTVLTSRAPRGLLIQQAITVSHQELLTMDWADLRGFRVHASHLFLGIDAFYDGYEAVKGMRR